MSKTIKSLGAFKSGSVELRKQDVKAQRCKSVIRVREKQEEPLSQIWGNQQMLPDIQLDISRAS